LKLFLKFEKLNTTQIKSKKLNGIIFISASIIFNISVSVLYIAVKLEKELLLQVFGAIILSMALPFTVSLVSYWKDKAGKKIIVSHIFILFYLFLELLLDYILKIPFREILALHIPYIIFFYAAAGSMIAVSFRINKKMGFVVTATFLVLIGCLIYLFSG